MLKRLPTDIIGLTISWLAPKDFYNLRSVIPLSHNDYWLDKTNLLEHAVQNSCVSLVKHCILQGSEITQEICELMFRKPIPSIHLSMYGYYHMMWQPEISAANVFILQAQPRVLSRLIRDNVWIPSHWDIPHVLSGGLSMRDKFNCIVQLDNTGKYSITEYLGLIVNSGYLAIFEYLIKKYSQFVTIELMDQIYSLKKWKMMAVVFTWCPKVWIEYLFGSYLTATDPQLVHDLRHCLPHMKPYNRAVFAGILENYHKWLWKNMTGKKNTLRTIEEINKLGLFEWDPRDFLDSAMMSSDTSYISYLLVNGLTVTAKDYFKASYFSNDVAQELYSHYVVQESYNLFLIILLCWVLIIGETLYNKLTEVKTIAPSKTYV